MTLSLTRPQDPTVLALMAFAKTAEGNALAKNYVGLLEKIDSAFAAHVAAHPDQSTCRPGCCDCCTGVFEITILDALLVASAIAASPVQEKTAKRALFISEAVESKGWAFPHWWQSGEYSEDFQELDNTPCPLLDDAGLCRIYASRPSICRLQGLVFDDPSGELTLEDDCPQRTEQPSPAIFDLHGYYTDEFNLYQTLRQAIGLPVESDMDNWDTLISSAMLWPILDNQAAGKVDQNG